MRAPILSRERRKTRNSRAPGFCIFWIARHARQTRRRAVAKFLGRTASIGFGRIYVVANWSRLLRETRETSAPVILSRCLFFPLGKRHARHEHRIGSSETGKSMEASMETKDERAKSWSDFMRAVHQGKRGNFAPARAIVERVRSRFGDAAAAAQRRELWRVIQAGEPK